MHSSQLCTSSAIDISFPYQLNSGAAYLQAGILALLQKERDGFEKGLNSLEIMVFLFALELYIF